MVKKQNKCSKKEYEVWKRGKRGFQFNQCIGEGKTWKSAWKNNKRAGQFMSGRYSVKDKKGKFHDVSV